MEKEKKSPPMPFKRIILAIGIALIFVLVQSQIIYRECAEKRCGVEMLTKPLA